MEQQELKLVFDADQGEFSIYYYQHRFPVDPQTYPFILSSQHTQLLNDFAPDNPVFLEYQTIDNSFSKLPSRTETTEEKIEERKRDKEVFKKHLARLCADNPSLIRFIDFRIAEINQLAGDSSELHALLEQQVYRLAYWRVAGDEINYRRFFDIIDLGGCELKTKRYLTRPINLSCRLSNRARPRDCVLITRMDCMIRQLIINALIKKLRLF